MGAPWSATRSRMFQECRRKYYYRYHIAPLGRDDDAPAEAREAHRVKDLVGVEAWAGELVHRLIETALNRWRAGFAFSEGEAVKTATQQLSRQYRDSQAYWRSHPDEFPRRPTLLDLHYFGSGMLTRDQASRIREMVCTSIVAFLRSDLAHRIRHAGPSRWLPIDRNAAAHLEDDLLILVRPDFAFRDGDFLHIIDWKTGRGDTFWQTVQVTCYALYAAEKWGQVMERIMPQVVHLHPEFRVAEVDYSPGSVRDVELFIRESHAEMAALSESETLPSAEQFTLSEDPRACRWCQFRGLCPGAARNAAL